jgi:hypothetical protein
VTAQADDPLATLIGPASGFLTSEDAEALWSRLGIEDDELRVEFIQALASLGGGDDDPASPLHLRVGRWRIDLAQQGIRSALMAAALAAVLASQGLNELGIALASAILPSVVEIERVDLSPADRRLLLEIRIRPAFRDGYASEDELYAALPEDTRRAVNRYDFADFIGRIRDAGLTDEAWEYGDVEPRLLLRDPGQRRPSLKIR